MHRVCCRHTLCIDISKDFIWSSFYALCTSGDSAVRAYQLLHEVQLRFTTTSSHLPTIFNILFGKWALIRQGCCSDLVLQSPHVVLICISKYNIYMCSHIIVSCLCHTFRAVKVSWLQWVRFCITGSKVIHHAILTLWQMMQRQYCHHILRIHTYTITRTPDAPTWRRPSSVQKRYKATISLLSSIPPMFCIQLRPGSRLSRILPHFVVCT